MVEAKVAPQFLKMNTFVSDEGFILTMMKEKCLVTMERCCLLQNLRKDSVAMILCH